MATKKSKIKKKPMTLEDFLGVIQRDLACMATKEDLKDMATKDDLQKLATREELREVREDVKRITDLMVSKADLAETLREELDKSAYARRIEELQTRVERLEEELGIKHVRRAA
jgi:hypothetical protein